MDRPKSCTIHNTAIVDEGAVIGVNTYIWHWSHISAGATIGNDCSIGQNVYVGGKARIGNGVKIQNNVSVYDSIVLEDLVFCGPSVVFTNVINPRAYIIRKDEYKPTIVRSGASLGANSTIICGIEIGAYAFVGAGAVVTSDVKPYSVVVGVPAIHRSWISEYGETFPLDLDGKPEWVCPHTFDRYTLHNGFINVSRQIRSCQKQNIDKNSIT